MSLLISDWFSKQNDPQSLHVRTTWQVHVVQKNMIHQRALRTLGYRHPGTFWACCIPLFVTASFKYPRASACYILLNYECLLYSTCARAWVPCFVAPLEDKVSLALQFQKAPNHNPRAWFCHQLPQKLVYPCWSFLKNLSLVVHIPSYPRFLILISVDWFFGKSTENHMVLTCFYPSNIVNIGGFL